MVMFLTDVGVLTAYAMCIWALRNSIKQVAVMLENKKFPKVVQRHLNAHWDMAMLLAVGFTGTFVMKFVDSVNQWGNWTGSATYEPWENIMQILLCIGFYAVFRHMNAEQNREHEFYLVGYSK